MSKIIYDIPAIELNYLSNLSYSILLLTVSLIFFHMTRVNSIELPRFYSSLLSIILVILSISFIILGIIQYAERISLELSHADIHDKTNLIFYKNEKKYWYTYLVLGIIVILFNLFLCSVMIDKSSILNFFNRNSK